MSFVRTVVGDITPAQLGVYCAHEYVIIDRSFTTQANPDFLIDDAEAATKELRQFHADAGRAMVDSSAGARSGSISVTSAAHPSIANRTSPIIGRFSRVACASNTTARSAGNFVTTPAATYSFAARAPS